MLPLCFYYISIMLTIMFLFDLCEKKKKIHVGEDRINKLPSHILSSIISLLPAEEALRTSVLSKYWKNVWTHASHLDFNQNRMLEPAMEQWLKFDKDLNVSETKVRAAYDLFRLQFKNSIKSIKKVLTNHCGVLERCRIVHTRDSCKNGDVVGLIRYLVDVKRVHELDLECRYIQKWDKLGYYTGFIGGFMFAIPIRILIPPTLDICFHVLAATCVVLKLKNYVLKGSPPLRVCENLKTLKLNKVWLSDQLFEGILSKCVSLEHLSLIGCKQLKRIKIHSARIKSLELREMTLHMIHVVAMNLEVIEFGTLICKWKGLVVDAPNLRVLRVSYGNPPARGMPKLRFRSVRLTARVILQNFTKLVTPEGSVRPNMLANLVTLCIDLDLNGGRDITALYWALKACNSLEQLEINNKALYSPPNSSPPDSKFWQKIEPCICVSQTLKTVHIRRIKGNVLEMEFIKYVIYEAKMLTRMTLLLIIDGIQSIFTSETFSIPRTPNNLRLTLNTGIN